MRLTYYELNFTAEFERGSIGAIILERSDVFECFLIALHKHLEKEETSFVLFEREKEMDLTKCCDFIASPFDLTFKKKAVTRNLFAELETVAGEADLSGCFCEIYGKILNVLEQLRLASDYVIGYSTDFSMQDIFKSCSVPVSYTHLDVYKRQDGGTGHRRREVLEKLEKLEKGENRKRQPCGREARAVVCVFCRE